MQMQAGIDLGGTAAKFVLCGPDGRRLHTWQTHALRQPQAVEEALQGFLAGCGAQPAQLSRAVLTGVGASFIPGALCGVPTAKVSEFEAIGCGGLAAAGLPRALVISMGTGTAVVLADGQSRVHVGGSGLGGGTICGLGGLLLGQSDILAISRLARQGRLQKVDLLVGDICCQESDTLPLCLTASNFGKVDGPAPADLALGLIHMVLQNVGKIAVFATQNTPVRQVVLTGALAGLPQAGPIFEEMGRLYGRQFLLPAQPAFATAWGAVLAAG